MFCALNDVVDTVATMDPETSVAVGRLSEERCVTSMTTVRRLFV